MRATYAPGQWIVFRYDLASTPASPSVPLSGRHRDLLNAVGRRGPKDRQPFLLSPTGSPDRRINAFFESRRVRRRSPLTWDKYAQSLRLWLNFLNATGGSWDEAEEEDAEFFKEWRLVEDANPRRVQPPTFRANLASLQVFYGWAAVEHGVPNPVASFDDFDLKPRGARDRDIKWLDPGGYARWRDLGLCGRDLDGRPERGWRGRNEQRDAAFADGLYSTGPRLTEWGSVLLPELPMDEGVRGFSTCRLASASAKGKSGHKYWIARLPLLRVLDYLEGARARAVRNAQAAGRYEGLRGVRTVNRVEGGRLRLVDADGCESVVAMEDLEPQERRRLFKATPQGLEPLAIWLNEDGLPRHPHGWQHTFAQANARISEMNLPGLACTPHMLRHSCALRWYSVGRLVYSQQFAHLDQEEAKDFREQFGGTWNLVATILGHASPETTKKYYLEPFISLNVEFLLQQIQGLALDGFLATFLAGHPLVINDPLAGRRCPGALPPAGYRPRRRVSKETPLQVLFIPEDAEESSQVFDFERLTVSPELQVAFATGFVQRTRASGKLNRLATARKSYKFLRGFATYLGRLNTPPPRTQDLLPVHLDGWRLERQDYTSLSHQVGELMANLRAVPGLAPEFRTALNQRRPDRANRQKRATPSYSRDENQRILNTARHDIRSADALPSDTRSR